MYPMHTDLQHQLFLLSKIGLSPQAAFLGRSFGRECSCQTNEETHRFMSEVSGLAEHERTRAIDQGDVMLPTERCRRAPRSATRPVFVTGHGELRKTSCLQNASFTPPTMTHHVAAKTSSQVSKVIPDIPAG